MNGEQREFRQRRSIEPCLTFSVLTHLAAICVLYFSFSRHQTGARPISLCCRTLVNAPISERHDFAPVGLTRSDGQNGSLYHRHKFLDSLRMHAEKKHSSLAKLRCQYRRSIYQYAPGVSEVATSVR